MQNSNRYHTQHQRTTLDVIQLTLIDFFQIMLKFRVSVGKRIGKLIDVVLAIETECERHDVVLSMIGTTVVEDVSSGQTLPWKYRQNKRRRIAKTIAEVKCSFTIVYDLLISRAVSFHHDRETWLWRSSRCERWRARHTAEKTIDEVDLQTRLFTWSALTFSTVNKNQQRKRGQQVSGRMNRSYSLSLM